MIIRNLFVILALALGLAALPAKAEETGTLDLELNSLSTSSKGCTVSFVMRNGLAAPIEALTFEIVLFKADGSIASLLSLKAGELPLGKTRVKQFRLKRCEQIVRILVNDIKDCRGGTLTPKSCLKKLNITNRTKIGFGL